VFPSFVVGGAQARFCAVANRHGAVLRHAIVSMDGNLSCRERLRSGLDVVCPAVVIRRGDTLGNLRRFRAVLGDLRPDVLLTHNFGAIEWALANLLPGARARHVHVEDGFGPEEQDRQLPRRVLLRRLALRRATVVLPSHVLLRIAQTIWRIDKRRLRYVPNGVDLSQFSPARADGDAPWRLPGAGPIVGTVAGLRPEKNVARLVRAVARVPGLRLVVIGDGPDRAALAALAAELGIGARVALVGHLDDPAAAYAHMDLFALSSDTEQMPLSVLEAMATGLPIASTDVGDVAAMVSEVNRPFVVPRDDRALAEALSRLAADPVQARAIGAANRVKAAAEYDQAQMFAAWGELLGATGRSA